MLCLERPLELLVLDDGVDAELAFVAVVGVLQVALAPLEQPAGCASFGRGARLTPFQEELARSAPALERAAA